jgi:2-haloacid dehalogenase
VTAIRALSFDCYGTLVNWEQGMLTAFAQLWPERSAAELLTGFARHESVLEAQLPILPYVDILRGVARSLADDFGVNITPLEVDRFAASIAEWPLFVDTLPVLESLNKTYPLVILSNVDVVSFAGTQQRLAHVLDAALIAAEIGAYKPDPAAFAALIHYFAERGIAPNQILHVAQSHYHDHGPAAAAGLRTCWLDRRAQGQQSDWGAVPPPVDVSEPEFQLADLHELPALLQQLATAA